MLFSRVCFIFGIGKVIAQSPADDGPIYSPLRPPSIPLAVRSPYTSTWSTTANGSTLNSQNVTFWTNGALDWSGTIRVDGAAYEYMGDSPSVTNLTKATPLTVSYDSHYSNFTFDAGPVRLTARFFSPVLPKDLCSSSIPLSYLEVAYEATDGRAHDVQLYSDVNAMWLARGQLPVRWLLDCLGGCSSGSSSCSCPHDGTITNETVFHWEVDIVQPTTWEERAPDDPYWGELHYVSSPGSAAQLYLANEPAVNARQRFVDEGKLNRTFDTDQPRLPGDSGPAFAFAHEFESSKSGSVLYTVGTTQELAVNYRTARGNVELRPWWVTDSCYGGLNNMISKHYHAFAAAAEAAARWTTQLGEGVASYYAAERTADMEVDEKVSGAVSDLSEEELYYAILALSARQIMAAGVLTESQPNGTEPTIFQKEISSDGKTNTVDIIYPALPFWLYANPELLRLLLAPVFDFQEAGMFHEQHAMHDIGRHYPNAIGYNKSRDQFNDPGGEEAMPVEESANMVILAYAYYQATNDTEYLKLHFTILTQWTQYLADHCLYPVDQVTSDDFNERLANNTNLAIKGIVAINAFAEIASAVGDEVRAAAYKGLATSYYATWSKEAISPSHTHTRLAYQWNESYSILYNTYPALLLNLPIIPDSLYDMQSSFYPALAQRYGVPLDNRRLWTKSDWEMWAAATSSPTTRKLFVESLARWVNETSTYTAFCDHFITDTGGYSDYAFIARPVVGGHFSLLALGKAGRHQVLVGSD